MKNLPNLFTQFHSAEPLRQASVLLPLTFNRGLSLILEHLQILWRGACVVMLESHAGSRKNKE